MGDRPGFKNIRFDETTPVDCYKASPIETGDKFGHFIPVRFRDSRDDIIQLSCFQRLEYIVLPRFEKAP